MRIGIVTGTSVGVMGDGEEPGRILQTSITDYYDVQNVALGQPGEEYHPPRGASVLVAAGGESYKVSVGVDDGIAPIMAQGGKRIYAVDAEGAAAVAEIRLHPDGKIEVLNGGASVTIDATGAITINSAGAITMQATNVDIGCDVNVTGNIIATGTITGETDVIADTISGKHHTHLLVSPSAVGEPQ